MSEHLDQADVRTLRKLRRIARESEPKRGILGAAVWRTVQHWLDTCLDEAEQTQVTREQVTVNVHGGGQSEQEIAEKVARSLSWAKRYGGQR